MSDLDAIVGTHSPPESEPPLQESASTPLASLNHLLVALYTLGIRVAAIDGRISYTDPSGRLTPDLADQLRGAIHDAFPDGRYDRRGDVRDCRPPDRYERLRKCGATIADIDGTPWASWRATDGCQCHASLEHHPTATVAGWVAKRERPPEHEIPGWRGIAREINRQRKGGGE